MKAFDEQDKYNWPLNRDSLVVDVGAYEGNFSRLIVEKFGCAVWAFEPVFYEQCLANVGPRTTVFRNALGNCQCVEEFGIKGDSTGVWAMDVDRVAVDVLPVSVLYAWNHVGLLKLNCEGGEYPILERIIRDGKAPMFDALLVQFHAVEPDSSVRRDNILSALEETHEPVFSAPFCWEGWKIKR